MLALHFAATAPRTSKIISPTIYVQCHVDEQRHVYMYIYPTRNAAAHNTYKTTDSFHVPRSANPRGSNLEDAWEWFHGVNALEQRDSLGTRQTGLSLMVSCTRPLSRPGIQSRILEEAWERFHGVNAPGTTQASREDRRHGILPERETLHARVNEISSRNGKGFTA